MGNQVALGTVRVVLVGFVNCFQSHVEGFSSSHMNHQLPTRPVDGSNDFLDIIRNQFVLPTAGTDHDLELAQEQKIVSKTR